MGAVTTYPRAQALLKEMVRSNPYREVLSGVIAASRGAVYLIGGFVYRSISECMYGTPRSVQHDMDFCIDGTVNAAMLRRCFSSVVRHSRYDAFRIVHRGIKADVFELRNFVDVVKHNLPASIHTYLKSVPLSVQSIAYDTRSCRIIGDEGMSSILKAEVSVNNPDKLLDGSFSISKAKRKAAELGFVFVPPETKPAEP